MTCEAPSYCETCGDCIHCYGEDHCYGSDSGDHTVTRIALFIFGPPAAGKTTLAIELIGDAPLTLTDDPKLTLAPDLCALGHYPGGRFGGGDHIPPGKGEAALIAAAAHGKPLTIIDGNRFALARHHGTAIRLFDRVLCVHLDAPEPELHRRRVARGSKTNPAWMAGRRGLTDRFAEQCPGTVRLQGTTPTAALATTVRSRLSLLGWAG